MRSTVAIAHSLSCKVMGDVLLRVRQTTLMPRAAVNVGDSASVAAAKRRSSIALQLTLLAKLAPLAPGTVS